RGVPSGLVCPVRCCVEILEPLLFTATQPDEGDGYFHTPRQASHHIIVGADHQFGVRVVGSQLQYPLVIVTCADCITQRRKPSPLYQSGIGGELSSGHAAGVESVSMVGIGAESVVLKFLGSLNECLDPLLRLRVSRAMSLAHKTVVGILTGIHRPHAVELAHQHSGGYMVHHEGIVRMLLESALKIL